MILVLLAGACLISVPLSGGHLSQLADLHLRCPWAAPLALALQVLIIDVAPTGSTSLHAAAHIATYGLGGLPLDQPPPPWRTADRHRRSRQRRRHRGQRRDDARVRHCPAPRRPENRQRIPELRPLGAPTPTLAQRHHPRTRPMAAGQRPKHRRHHHLHGHARTAPPDLPNTHHRAARQRLSSPSRNLVIAVLDVTGTRPARKRPPSWAVRAGEG